MRVFLSHTSELAAFPTSGSFVDAAKRAVIRAGHVPVEMDDFPATPTSARSASATPLLTCDVYVGLFGTRWGTPLRDDPSRSYTEFEYDTARAAGLPCLIFRVDPNASLPQAFWADDHAARQSAFRDRVSADVVHKLFSSPLELETLLFQALTSLAPADRAPVFAVPPVLGDEVPRPGLLDELVAAVTSSASVGMTTQVTGASGGGGFGKTTLARLLAHDPRVRGHFADGILWTTIGADAQPSVVADRLNDLTALLTGQRPALLDQLAAGAELASAATGRRLLIIVDDVWTSSQLEPFLQAGVVLTTTRRPAVLPASATVVRVDMMAGDEASSLLSRDLPTLPAALVTRLLRLTGRWPVLLGLVNGAARSDVLAGASSVTAMTALADHLASSGPDQLRLSDEHGRGRAITVTLEASLTRLTPEEQARYRELAVFGEDVDIPRAVLELYWNHTGGLSPYEVADLCRRLYDLGLLAEYRLDNDNPRLRLHGVIRAWLHTDAPTGLDETILLSLPYWKSLSPYSSDSLTSYIWEWVPAHLRAAGHLEALTAMLTDPAWLLRKLEVSTPSSLERGLQLDDDPVCRALARVVRQAGHLLAPLRPPGALAATLASRMTDVAELRDLRASLLGVPRLEPADLPDLPHPALIRVFGQRGAVSALIMAPDGQYVASGGIDGQIQILGPDGSVRPVTTAGPPIRGLAFGPDGAWLAASGGDGSLRLWNTADLALRLDSMEKPHNSSMFPVIDPGGRWIIGAPGPQVTIRNTIDGEPLAVISDLHSPSALAAAPDGSWVVAAGADGTVTVWDTATGALRQKLPLPERHHVRLLRVDPTGCRIAGTTRTGMVVLWHVTGERLSLPGQEGATGDLLFVNGGKHLLSGGWDRTVQVWDTDTGERLRTLAGHNGTAIALAAGPGDSWVVTTGSDTTVRLWELETGLLLSTLTGHSSTTNRVVVSPDGTWLATSGTDNTVRMWSTSAPLTWRSAPSRGIGVVGLAARNGPVLSALQGGQITFGNLQQAESWTETIGQVLAMTTAAGWIALSGSRALVARDFRSRRKLLGFNTNRSQFSHLAAPRSGAWVAAAWRSTMAKTNHMMVSVFTVPGEQSRWGRPVDGRVTHLAAAPDGTWVAAITRTQLLAWDASDGRARFSVPQLDGHTALIAASDSSWLATGDERGVVRIRNSHTGEEMRQLPGDGGLISALAVSDDLIAVADGRFVVRVWAQQCRHTFSEAGERISRLAFGPGARRLAGVTEGGAVHVWDLERGRVLSALRVDSELEHLVWADADTVVVGGERGPYFLKVVE